MQAPSTTTLVAVLGAPPTTLLYVAGLMLTLVVAGRITCCWLTRPARPEPQPRERSQLPPPPESGPLESPAVIAALAHGGRVPNEAVTATMFDLASRGWIKIATGVNEAVLTSEGNQSDPSGLAPHEQHVLSHILASSTEQAVSASTLSAARTNLSDRWWRYFRAHVRDAMYRAGLATPRYEIYHLAPLVACNLIGLTACWYGFRNAESAPLIHTWSPRLWLVTLTAALLVTAHGLFTMFRDRTAVTTAHGTQRATAWLRYRWHLVDRIPNRVGVVGTPAQHRALARAVGLGVSVAPRRLLPIVSEDPVCAWSPVSGLPVRVWYPPVPGYGHNPARVGVAGLAMAVIAWKLHGLLVRLADAEIGAEILDWLPRHEAVVTTVAGVLATACVVPLAVGLWMLIAGLVDTFAVRSVRGVVVRARRPTKVFPSWVNDLARPLGQDAQFMTYIAIDTGASSDLICVLADAHQAAAQGQHVELSYTPLLGYVQQLRPVSAVSPPIVQADSTTPSVTH